MFIVVVFRDGEEKGRKHSPDGEALGTGDGSGLSHVVTL